MEDPIIKAPHLGAQWVRALYVALFVIIYQVVEVVLWALVVFQVLFSLIMGKPNQNLQSLGKNVSQYMYHILKYVTFNQDIMPYPFTSWPGSEEE